MIVDVAKHDAIKAHGECGGKYSRILDLEMSGTELSVPIWQEVG